MPGTFPCTHFNIAASAFLAPVMLFDFRFGQCLTVCRAPPSFPSLMLTCAIAAAE